MTHPFVWLHVYDYYHTLFEVNLVYAVNESYAISMLSVQTSF